MIHGVGAKLALAALLLMLPVATLAGTEEGPSVAEQVQHLQSSCEASAEVRETRHAERPLYERLGGYQRILALTTEVVRLHKQNDAIKQMFTHVDEEQLARHVADFMSAGTGGTAEYTGRSMPAAHAKLRLTDADFLAAGGDIVTAMQSQGYEAEEIDEVVCILVSLKDQVVLN